MASARLGATCDIVADGRDISRLIRAPKVTTKPGLQVTRFGFTLASRALAIPSARRFPLARGLEHARQTRARGRGTLRGTAGRAQRDFPPFLSCVQLLGRDTAPKTAGWCTATYEVARFRSQAKGPPNNQGWEIEKGPRKTPTPRGRISFFDEARPRGCGTPGGDTRDAVEVASRRNEEGKGGLPKHPEPAAPHPTRLDLPCLQSRGGATPSSALQTLSS